MEWDWSAAGQDLGDDPHIYLKIKGSFVYESNVQPQYMWYNGMAYPYILGDIIDPESRHCERRAAWAHPTIQVL